MLAIGAFSTLNEAERAAAGLLEAEFPQDELAAVARTGGGRMLLAGRVPVRAVGSPARLVDMSERAGAGALAVGLLGALAAAAYAIAARGATWDLLAPLRGPLADPVLLGLAILLGAVAGGLLGAALPRSRGLPHEMALRYARRLDQGDTVVGVRTATPAQAAAARETLTLHGAVMSHTTRGTLEPHASAAALAETLPTPSQN